MSALGNSTRGYRFATCPECGRKVSKLVPGTFNFARTSPTQVAIFQTHNIKHADGTWGDVCKMSRPPVTRKSEQH